MPELKPLNNALAAPWLAMAALALCLSGIGCSTETQATASAQPAKMRVIGVKVTQVAANETIAVSGTLVADKTVPLSFQVPGKVDQVLVDEGDHVKAGQLLASLEDNDFRSNLAIAGAVLMNAEDAFKRHEPLYRKGAFPEKNYIDLKAGLAQARAGAEIAAKKLKDTRLTAPIGGIIGRKELEAGQMVSPGRPVFIIVKTDRVFAKAAVPEAEIGRVDLGQKAEVAIPALDGRTLIGRVSLIGAMADPRTRTYTVKIELANPDYILRAGMIARVRIITDRKIAMLTVPGRSIVRDASGLTYVFRADPESGRAFRQRVIPGSVYRNQIEIKDGLNKGDTIITAGQHRLEDGQAVTLVKP